MVQEADTEQPEGIGKSKRRSRRWLLTALLACLVIAIALLAGGAWVLTQHAKWPDPQLVTAARSSTYPIYYPNKLPKGFSRKVAAITDAGTALTYTLQYDGNKRLVVSAIPAPPNVRFADFYNRLLSNPTVVPSSTGTAVLGNANNQLVGLLGTTKTWVTINAPNGIDANRLHAVVANLRQL